MIERLKSGIRCFDIIISPSAFGSYLAQDVKIRNRNNDISLIILQISSLRQRHRRSRLRPHGNDIDAVSFLFQLYGHHNRSRIGIIGNQNNLPVTDCRPPEQFTGFFQTPVGPTALHRHRAGIKTGEKVENRGPIIGQRCDNKTVTSKNHQALINANAGFYQINGLVAGPAQAVWRQIR